MMSDAQHERTVGRLDNWGAWSRSGGSGESGGTCGSAERFYREAPRHSAPMSAADTRDAVLVDEAISKLANARERNLLRATFVGRHREDELAARFKVGRSLVGALQRRAVQGVFEILTAIDMREVKLRARRLKLAAFANGIRAGV